MAISKIEKLPVKSIWKHEERDFTPWLKDNIDSLSEALNIKLIQSTAEKEKEVGTFSLDILVEDESGGAVVIENQFNKSDHDHLGKLLTYMTNLSSKTAIWIVEEPRQEHINTVNWLNETTSEDISFYIVKIEAVKIDNSNPAPLFSVVVSPSVETKKTGGAKKEWAERNYIREKFWTTLLDKSNSVTQLFSNRKPSKYHYIGIGSGTSGVTFNYVVTLDSGSTELYIDKGDQKRNKELFDMLYKEKDSIEKEYGDRLEWERLDDKRASRVAKYFNEPTLYNEENWDSVQDKMIDSMIRFEKAFKKYIPKMR